jgi:hypothetical protein
MLFCGKYVNVAAVILQNRSSEHIAGQCQRLDMHCEDTLKLVNETLDT